MSPPIVQLFSFGYFTYLLIHIMVCNKEYLSNLNNIPINYKFVAKSLQPFSNDSFSSEAAFISILYRLVTIYDALFIDI